MAVKAYLEITMQIPAENRKAAAKVYSDYRKPFLETIPGAESKALLGLLIQKLESFQL
ncbi:MAG: hypothetical protein QP756_08135 [Lactobacillus crispatus]|uniref:hypothetical protein n=1 Tax=Lactobacillus crispatus TaxID=47770 RepID=UPI0015E0A1AA|nr:hypothetical protein [Lactobacillus crispatus]MDK7321066.1 hypothetical protein [Lactobacillus crispatus]MDK8273333.1 hypothetical protein [Lactobacillus crispatus]MDK8569502.1 hypothetical protein [Lactobacillus crispatus]